MKKLSAILLLIISVAVFSSCGKTGAGSVTDNGASASGSQPDNQNIEIHKPVSAEETILLLSSMEKAAACEYLQQNYTEPLERAMLLTKDAAAGENLAQKYTFYYFMAAVFNNIDYYKENYPAGSEKNTVCVPADEVEEYLSLFIENTDSAFLRTAHNSFYNSEQNGYQYFVGETSWITDSTQVFDYSTDEEKLTISYYILPIDSDDKIPMAAVFCRNGDYYKYSETLSL